MQTVLVLFLMCVIFGLGSSVENKKNEINVDVKDIQEFTGRIFEKGRTLVHNSIKRFMVILPAIFFKLGIAFTMLVLVTIVSVNNGFIGFLLLVVGLSSVLARLQETRRSPVVPYINPVPVYQTKYVQDWDRKDKFVDTTKDIYGPQYGYSQLSGYYRQNQ